MSTRYWIGGTGNWSDGAHWSASSGGATDNTVPTSADDVHFDAGSNTTNAAYTVTVDTTANCKDLMFDAKPGDGLGGTITLTGSAALNIYGSLLMLAGMTRTYTGIPTLRATTTGKTITTNGVSFSYGTNFTFNGVGGGWTLQDDLNLGSSSPLFTNGSVDLNGKTLSGYIWQLQGGSLTFSSGTANAKYWQCAVGMTIADNTGTINVQEGYFQGGGKSYGTLVLAQFGGAATYISGANTFVNLTRTGTAVKTDTLQLYADQTVTGTLTITGNSETNRLLIQSNTLGTPRTITAAAVALTNCDFMDITGAGAASPFTGTSLGNCLGNSGITFTTAADQYWYTTTTGSKTWSTAGNWFLGSGGTGGAGRVPLPQDNCIFDANSIGAASTAVNIDMPRLGKDITWTGVTNTPTLNSTGASFAVYGSFTYASGMVRGGNNTTFFQGRGSHTLTTAGVPLTGGVYVNTFGGSLTLGDTLVMTGAAGLSQLQINSGTFNDGGYAVTATAFSSVSGTTKNKSGTWTITGSDTTWNESGTFNDSAGSIKLTDATATTKTFAGGGKTYNNIWLAGAGSGSFNFTGSNTFNDFKVDGGNKTIKFTAGTTTTLASFTKADSSTITITSITAATHTITKTGGGRVSIAPDGNVSYSIASPQFTFYAGDNSINGGNNTNWIFIDPPGPAIGVNSTAIGLKIGVY